MKVCSHQAEDGRERAPPVVVAAAELQVEQQSVVGDQVKAVGVHQRLAAQGVACLETRRVDPTCRDGNLGQDLNVLRDQQEESSML